MDVVISERMMDTFDIHRMSIMPLFFQTGYLTVEEVLFDEIPERYRLKIPNFEVREAFFLQIIDEFTENGTDFAETAFRKIRDSLKTGDLSHLHFSAGMMLR